MKTPEEIKADAATCLTKPPHAMCDRFDLNKKCKGDCSYVIKELYDLVLHYESRLAEVERERDAAVGDLQEAARDGAVCTACKHDEEFAEACAEADFDCKQCKQPCMCKTCNANSNYEWIGLCEENTHDQP